MKTGQEVGMPENGLRKRTMVQRNGKRTYAITREKDGAKLVRFVSEQQYDAVQAPEIEGS